MFTLIITTFSLLNGVLQHFGFVEFNLILVGLWKFTKKTLDYLLLILEVGDIPQQIHKYFGICIHGKLSQLKFMEFLYFVIIILF
jgi:hypothetical protein